MFDFLLVPVVWGEVIDLQKVAAVLKRNPWKYKGVIKPLAFVNFTDGTRNVYQRFKDLESIFDNEIPPEFLVNDKKEE